MSTIPAVIAALVALGQATLDGELWETIDGPIETVTTAAQRLLLVGDAEIISPTDFDSLGSSGMSERYTVPLLISVSLPGPDSLITARTQAFATHEEIRDAILNSPSLGLVAQGVLSAFPTSERRVQQYATPEGRSVAIRFGLDVYAQLV